MRLSSMALTFAGSLALAAAAAAQGARGPAPLTSQPEVRWSSQVLAFECEPLVEGAHVLVAGRDPTGRRALVVLDLESGRVRSRTLFPASLPLAVALAGERVAVRTTPSRVDLFRLRAARLLLERSFVHASSVSAPVLAADELLLREGDELVRYDLREREATWRLRVPGAFHGAPVARDGAVFAGWYDESGGAHLAWIERASGALHADLSLGRPVQGTPPERDALEVHAHGTLIFVRLPPGLPATSGRVLEWARVPFDGRTLGRATLHDFQAPPLETDAGWVAPERGREGSTAWLLARREEQDSAPTSAGERAVELAAPTHHAWLAASHTAASRAGDVLYLGPCAADARSLAVLWRRPSAPELRPVPVPGGLLVIEGGTLRLLGGEPVLPDPAREKARELARTRERALGERLALLASKALRSAEAELAGRLALEAEALGASGRTLELVRAESARQSAPGQPQPQAPPARAGERRTALALEESAARAALLTELAGAARLAADGAARIALLEQLFRRDAEHPQGLEVLRGALPRGTRVAPGEASSWLELLAVAAAHPIELVTDATLAPPAERRRLEGERATWRADAVGYRSERLLVVTAGAAPGAVARTLQAGELVCDVLERTFGAPAAAAERLELVLYPTRAEYLAHSGSDLGGLETVLGFTAGHFDLGARVSRLFLPEGDGDLTRLRAVSAHELAHHWLATRSRFGPPRSTQATPGFWVVEAIATWVEELHLDPARGTWRSDTARAASLDTLRNAAARDLLDWGALLSASFEDYTKLETRATATMSLDWQLGAQAQRSPLQLFYAQGCALLTYLHEAEGGAHRPLFLGAVESFYRGQPLDVPAALGLAPAELGARVTAWAKSAP